MSGDSKKLRLTLETSEHGANIHTVCVPGETTGEGTAPCQAEITPCLDHPEKIRRLEIGVAGLGVIEFSGIDAAVLDVDGNILVASDPIVKDITITRTSLFSQPILLPLR
jgi:hypothetical protein